MNRIKAYIPKSELNEDLSKPRLGNYAWNALAYFNFYRVLIPIILALVYVSPFKPDFLGSYQVDIFKAVLAAYLSFNLVCIVIIRGKRFNFEWLVSLLVSFDIVAVILLMHSSGGISSGIGMLLAVSCASASLLLANRFALLFTATAALAILGEQSYRQLILNDASSSYVQAGILGATFFVTSILSLILAQRTVAAEEKAQKRSEDIHRLQHLNERVIQYMTAGVLVVNHSGTIELYNQSAWKLLGMPEKITTKPLVEINYSLDKELRQWKKHAGYRPGFIYGHGDTMELEPRFQWFSEEKDTLLVFLEDRSHLTQTAQNMKLGSLGRLTASIAHEIRNPLGALSHASQLLDESEVLSSDDRELLQIILTHSVRMNTIIENIMVLSQRKEAKKQAVQLDVFLPQFVEDFAISREPAPVISFELKPTKFRIPFDISQLHQILTNLCENAARFSFEKTKTPTVMMFGAHKYGTKQFFLDVIDNGTGVDPKNTEQIFEPFFTTSKKGSGLGLYLARELCEANGARLEYIPTPKGGACFRIHFGELSER
jgi:two-component system sensor histidine kinase PilS (NtrC family)